MASFREFWRRLLRAFRAHQPHVGPTWVEPGNAVTRAIYDGSSFVTMATWDDPQRTFTPAPPVPLAETAVSQPSGPDAAAAEPATPTRRETAA
ncbi:MAG: hypothetical protein ACREN5_15430 [Gemmatimonadales bacterium]